MTTRFPTWMSRLAFWLFVALLSGRPAMPLTPAAVDAVLTDAHENLHAARRRRMRELAAAAERGVRADAFHVEASVG